MSNFDFFFSLNCNLISHFWAPSSYLGTLTQKRSSQSSIKVILTSFTFIFFQLRIKKKTKIQNSTPIEIKLHPIFCLNFLVTLFLGTISFGSLLLSLCLPLMFKSRSRHVFLWNRPQFYIQLVYKPHFETSVLLVCGQQTQLITGA